MSFWQSFLYVLARCTTACSPATSAADLPTLPVPALGGGGGGGGSWGQLSGMVEPLGGVLGAYAVLLAKPILPYALSFAAGAMVFVVVDQLVRA